MRTFNVYLDGYAARIGFTCSNISSSLPMALICIIRGPLLYKNDTKTIYIYKTIIISNKPHHYCISVANKITQNDNSNEHGGLCTLKGSRITVVYGLQTPKVKVMGKAY